MRLLILGATGPTGRLTVEQALAQDHRVTALSRSAATLDLDHPALTRIACDVTTDAAGLAAALEGQDAVISTLGRGLKLRSQRLIERSFSKLLPALEKHGLRRLVVLSAFGVGSSLEEAPALLRFVFRTMLASIYRDKAIGEEMIRASSLDWTLVRAVLLTNSPATGEYEFGEDLPRAGARRIARADVAAFLLRCAADASFSRRTVVVRS